MTNFTKEYIELCEDKKIQELRPTIVEGDKVLLLWGFGVFGFMTSKSIADNAEKPFFIKIPNSSPGEFWYRRDEFLWLPTGNQLDEEIIKTTVKHRHSVYSINYWFKNKTYSVIIDGSILREVSDANPLICKIKLLLELLQEVKE